MLEALEADRRAHVVALARVVEDDVEDHLDPGLVQRLHHVAELGDLRALARGRRSSSPAVRSAGTGRSPRSCAARGSSTGLMPRTSRSSKANTGSSSTGGHAELLEVRDLLDQAGERARVLDAGGRRRREAADVHLVDDRRRSSARAAARRPPSRSRAPSTITARIDDSRLSPGRHASTGFQSVFVLPFAYGSSSTFSVVEAVSGRVRAVDAVGVVVARREAADVHVPEVEAAVDVRVERDRRDRVQRRRARRRAGARRRSRPPRRATKFTPPSSTVAPSGCGRPALERRERGQRSSGGGLFSSS